MDRRIKLSDSKKLELLRLFSTGNYIGSELSRMFSISRSTVSSLLKKNGYKVKSISESHRKYSINDKFFDNVDTQEKAYVLGLLYADGCNCVERGTIILALKESDKELLDKLTKLFQSNRPLLYVDISKRKNKQNGFENSQNQYILNISNKYFSNKLVELGCVKAKTFKLKFPTENQVPKHLWNHFIRGYIDGDGYINYKEISITGTLELCEKISEILKTELNINSYIRNRHPERNNNNRTLRITKVNDVYTILKWIYTDSHLHLERKYKKFQELSLKHDKRKKKGKFNT